jgi:U3 small nucleolar RNA-associated protein 15
VIQELIHRDGLRVALSGRDDVLLEPILRLLIKYVADHRFGEMVANVASIVLGDIDCIKYIHVLTRHQICMRP